MNSIFYMKVTKIYHEDQEGLEEKTSWASCPSW